MTKTAAHPPHSFGPLTSSPISLQSSAGAALGLAALAEELRRLQRQYAAQARRLDELEAREHLSWTTRTPYAQLEIDP